MSPDRSVSRNNFEFNITPLVELSPHTINAALRGISMVWEKHNGSPTKAKVTFGRRILKPDSDEDTGVPAYYSPSTNMFAFAAATIHEKYGAIFPKEKIYLLLGAHEGAHKVQVARGDPPKYSDLQVEPGDPHEDEAWTEAVHVYRKVYPNDELSFTAGDVTYTLPQVSKY